VSKTLDLNLGDEGDDAKLDFSDSRRNTTTRARAAFRTTFLDPDQHLTLMLIEVASFTRARTSAMRCSSGAG